MRNPHLWRNVGLVFAASGVVGMTVVIRLPEAAMGDTARIILAGYGLLAIIFGALWSLYRHAEARAKDALRRGNGVIARWRVDPATWREFAALNDTFSVNALPVRRHIPAEGVEVLAGKTAVMIDGFVQTLNGQTRVVEAALRGRGPACIYMTLRIATYRGPAVRTWLVFPAAADAHREAHSVVAHYRGTPLPGGASPLGARHTRPGMAAWGLLVLGFVMTGGAGTLLFLLWPMLLQPGISIDGARFPGTARQALLVLGVLGVLPALGVTAMLYGLWRIKPGPRVGT